MQIRVRWRSQSPKPWKWEIVVDGRVKTASHESFSTKSEAHAAARAAFKDLNGGSSSSLVEVTDSSETSPEAAEHSMMLPLPDVRRPICSNCGRYMNFRAASEGEKPKWICLKCQT
jgi:tRNA(Ile2) C34 agmatinyltransferase TiaS